MTAEKLDKCVSPAKGPVTPQETAGEVVSDKPTVKEKLKMGARVGQPAPDFEAAAFLDGGFQNIKLSDYKGKWVVVCFYPGDFTFV